MIQFGTPASQFQFLFDSGSTKTWIKDRNCVGCAGTYNPSDSQTFVLSNSESSTISYADGTSVSGPAAQDTVVLHGLTVEKFEFILVRSILDTGTNTAYQGIAGFGPTSEKSASLFMSIFQKHPNLAPVISYFIDESQTNGGITVGGIDTARFSGPLAVQEISTSSAGESDGFSLPLDSIKVGENDVTLTAAAKKVLIDTGTSLTILPMDVAKQINEQLNFIPLKKEFSGLFGKYCPNSIIPDGLPNITITMGRVKLKITPDIYIFFIMDQNRTYCVSGIQGSTKDFSIIGNVFLRRYYTVFDLEHKRVGFATCNRQSKVKASIVNTNLMQKVVGIADPKSVFGETSSESFGHKAYVLIDGLIILIIIQIIL